MDTSRERLVAAMSDLLWERGYAATSPREVRERSGVGQGSMYHHFPTKRDLGVAGMQRNIDDLLPSTVELLGSEGDPLQKLQAYLTRPRDALKGCRIGRMTQDPVVVADPVLLGPVADAFQQIHAALAQVVREAIKVGELPAELNPDRLAALLSATIQGGYVLAKAQQDRAPFDEACAGALELVRAAATTRGTDPTPHPGATSTSNPQPAGESTTEGIER